MREHRLTRLFVAAALLMGATVALTVAATPSTVAALRRYVVTSTSDAPWNGTPGVCASTAPLAPCTLRAALDLMAADFAVANFDDITIDLTQLDRGATIPLNGPLAIPNMLGRRVVLAGSNDPSRRVLLAGDGSFGLLEYNGGPSDSLEIIGLALRDGGGVNEGGALWASGDIILRNVEATSNTAGNGGAVYVEGWNAQIYDSAFVDNLAMDSGQGGAIKVVSSTLRVERTSFVDNVAADQGGAIWMQGRLNSAPIVRDSTFRANEVAANEGSAIYCASCDPFNSNTVLEAVSIIGGVGASAAVHSDGNVIASNVTFAGNAGPAIRANGGTLTHTTITGNGSPAITATGASGPPIGQFSAASSIIDGACSGAAVQVSPGASVIATGGCPTTGGGEVLTGPVTFAEQYGADGIGVRTGDGATLPVLVMTSRNGLAPCADPFDARGWTRGDVCDHGAAQEGVVPLAATYTTTWDGDSPDVLTGDGACADAAGLCTLRAAVMEAQAFPQVGADTIDMAYGGDNTLLGPNPNGSYACDDLATARCGGLEIITDLRALGPADPTLIPPIVRAPGSVFRTNAGDPNDTNDTNGTDLVIERLDLIGGELVGDGGVVHAVLDGTSDVTIRDSRLRGGRALGSVGGGLAVSGVGGTATLERVLIDSNFASAGGGGLSVSGGVTLVADELAVVTNTSQFGAGINIGAGVRATITNSLIQDNDASLGGSGGGGLTCTCTDVELRQVTIARNTAQSGAGLLYRAPSGPSAGLRVVNSSILANENLAGAAVAVRGGAGVEIDVELTNVTISQNSVQLGTTAGLEVGAGPGAVTVTDSVLARNTGASLADCGGPITTAGVVFAQFSECSVTSGPAINTVDAALNTVADVPLAHGGERMALQTIPVASPPITSPVVDTVPCTPAIATDVTGKARPNGARCDAGSVEAYGIGLRMFPASAAPTAAGAGIAISSLPPSAVRPRAGSTATLGAGVAGQAIRANDFQASPIGRITLGDLPIGRIAADADALGRIPLSSVPVTGGWAPLLANTRFADIPLQNVTLGEVLTSNPPVSGVAALRLDQLDLSASPIGRIQLGAIAFANVPIGRITLPAGTEWCRDIIVPSLPVGGPSCGAGQALDPANPNTTLFALSLQGVPIGRIPLEGTPIGRIDLAATPIGRIPIGRIDLAASPIGRIPIGRIGLTDTPIGRIQIEGTPIGRIPIGRIPLTDTPIGRIPIGRIALADTPIGRIPIGRIALADSPIGRIPIGRIDLAASPIGRIPIGRIDLQDSPIGRIPIGRIPIGRIPLVVNCALVDCATADLAEAAVAGALLPGTTLADLGEYGGATLSALVAGGALDDIPLSALGFFGDAVLSDLLGDPALAASGQGVATLLDIAAEVTLADLAEWPAFAAAIGGWTLAELVAGLPADVLAELTLGDLLQGVVDPADYPWEDLDLEAAAGELAANNGEVTFVVEIESALTATGSFDVSITLPTGFTYVPDSLTYDGTVIESALEPDGKVSALLQGRPGLSRLHVSALVPLTVGAAGRAETTLTVSDTVGSLSLTAASTDQVVSEAFELNDTAATATPMAADTLYLTHLATTDDEDWFALQVAQGERASVILSNLTSDFDLTLFGPTGTQLRGAPDGSLVPAADGGRSLLAADTVPAVVPADDIDLTAPAGTSLFGVSANRGAMDERVDTTALEAGRYLVRVTGYQGASSARPYALRASLTPSRFSGACPAVDRTAPSPLPPLDTVLPAGITTLFVVDRGRLASVYADGADDVTSKLDEFTALVNQGAGDDADQFGAERAGVLDVSSLAGVQTAYDTWDGDPCNPAAANAVVSQVGAAIDNALAAHPTIAHVVLVGNDDQIPFARVRDATIYSNEREYAPEVGDAQSPLTAALSLGYILSDDPYGDAHPVMVGPRELFAPTIAVGRLVETPAEIGTALSEYLSSFGRLDPSTAFSSGYDFLTDGAEAVADALDEHLVTGRLTTPEWTAGDLEGDLDDSPDIASVNAHFDHYRALPADQDARGIQSELFTIADVADDADLDGDGDIDPGPTATALQGALLFSMGCHGGLSVSDDSVGGLHNQDWAQTLTGIGAIFVANSGYGYGDDTVVGATEDLMRRFATGLGSDVTAGQALADAKQQYLAATKFVTPFDEKVSSQVIFYGLPQFRVGEAPVAPPPSTAVTRDGALQLDAAPVTVSGTIGDGLDLDPTTGPRGVYYSYRGDTLATADQPVQPRAIVDLTSAGRELRGVLLTGLASSDVAAPNPVVFTPTVDLAATSPEVRTTPTSFPTSLQSVSHYVTSTGRRDQAILVPGQFFGDPASTMGGGTQRLFTTMTGRAFYAPRAGEPGAGDVTVPLISKATAVLDGGTLSLRADVEDGAGEVRRVTILYTSATAPGSWTEVVLADLGGGTFGADVGVSGLTAIDFYVQALDSGGHVAVSSNKGANFESLPAAPPTITASGPLDANGWFTGPVEVAAAPFAAGPVDVTVNGVPATSPLVLTEDGAYEVVATTPNGPSSREIVRIDTGAPTISASTSTPSPATGPVMVELLGTDAGIGVETITWSTAGAETNEAVTTPGATVSVPITAAGVTTLTAIATDSLGRPSAPVEVVVTIEQPPDRDTVAPAVQCAAGPVGWVSTDVTIECTATDDKTGLADPAQANFALTTAVPDGSVAASAITGGTTVCDRADNCTTVEPRGPFQVDRAAPTITAVYPTQNGTVIFKDRVVGEVQCGDVGSGVASCTIGAINTSTVGPKTVQARVVDTAGNVVTINVTYRVVYEWSGFYFPVVDPPQINLGIAGLSYPVSFNLFDGNGRRVRDRAAIVSIQSVTRSCATPTYGPPVELSGATTAGGLTDAVLLWLYVWKTPKVKGCYQLRVNLNDGTTHVADFRLF